MTANFITTPSVMTVILLIIHRDNKGFTELSANEVGVLDKLRHGANRDSHCRAAVKVLLA